MRVELTGGSDSVKGVAFLVKGLPIVVLLNTSGDAQAVEFAGLPQGRYGRCLTSATQGAYGKELPETRVPETGKLATDLPPRSVTTLTCTAG